MATLLFKKTSCDGRLETKNPALVAIPASEIDLRALRLEG
jgi:hypothetical protein